MQKLHLGLGTDWGVLEASARSSATRLGSYENGKNPLWDASATPKAPQTPSPHAPWMVQPPGLGRVQDLNQRIVCTNAREPPLAGDGAARGLEISGKSFWEIT